MIPLFPDRVSSYTRHALGRPPVVREAVLDVVRRHSRVSLPELGELLGRSPATCRGPVRHLVSLGLVSITSRRPTIVEPFSAGGANGAEK